MNFKMASEKTKWKKWLGPVLGVFAGLWAVVIIVLQIVLSPDFLTKTANRLAAQYIDGEISFGRISASMFSSFPYLNVTAEDFSIVYPHGRYAAYDSLGAYGRLLDEGRGTDADTLISVRSMALSVDYVRALGGKIRIARASVDRPRIFAHSYSEGTANWGIFRFAPSEEEEADTTAVTLPDIEIRHLSLTGRPHIVYTSQSDTVYAALNMKETSLDGRISTKNPGRGHFAFAMDSLRVAGRLPADSLLFALDRCSIDAKSGRYAVGADARIFIASRTLGRLAVPAGLTASVSLQNRGSIEMEDLHLTLATLDITGNALVTPSPDSTYIRAEVSLNDCPVQRTIETFCAQAMPGALKLKTDASLTLTALCDGYYHPGGGSLPELVAELVVPRAEVAYEGIGYRGEIALDINAATDSGGMLSLSADNIDLYLAGIGLSASGSIFDPLGDDPLFEVELIAEADLEEASAFLPEGMSATGTLSAYAGGMILASDMSPYNFSRADIEGYLKTDGLTFASAPDTLEATVGKTSVTLAKAGRDSLLGAELLGFKGEMDEFYATIGSSTFARAGGVTLSAQNASGTFSEAFGKEFHPIVGTVGAKEIAMAGTDSLYVAVRNTVNSFKLSSRADRDQKMPILALSSSNGRISLRKGATRLGFRKASFGASAVKRPAEEPVDTGTPEDPLLAKYAEATEDGFERHGAGFSVSDAVQGYLTGWDLGGYLSIGGGMLTTPYFPLRNTISGAGGHFDNNSVALDSLTFRSGTSDISAKGSITGLTEALAGDGVLALDLDISSRRINANELLAAYEKGSRYVREGWDAMDEGISDEQYMESVTGDSTAVADTSLSLLVLPRRISADISIQGEQVDYSTLLVDWFSSDIALKNRTLKVTNTVATSNMGDIYAEGFYSTVANDKISAGFDLNMVDITADKVLELFPAVDTLMPMLTSFKGNLDCEVAATTIIDTTMSIILPSVNGIMKISGRDLSLAEDDALRKIAKILMFKDRNNLNIADMSVQGIISDNQLEIFPFVLGVDRYRLALSGIQCFDQSFNYHVSVIGSPLPFRFGVNLSGDFDNWKWRLCKARYKNANVPVFTKEIHDMHYSLIGVIHDVFDLSIEKALDASRQGVEAVEASKEAAGYDPDREDEELDEYVIGDSGLPDNSLF